MEEADLEDADLIDTNEAARLTGLKPQTLYRLARKGRLRSYRVLERAVRFDRADVQALVCERQSDRH